MDTDNMREETARAIAHPKPGMRFHEMFSAWVYIIAVLPKGGVITREFGGHPKNPPCDGIEFKTYRTRKEFLDHIQYFYYCDNKAFAAIERELIVTAKELNEARS